jgi:hypothetical protein
MLTSYIPSRDASLISSIRFELSALRHPKSKPCATGNILKTKGQRGPEPILNWRIWGNLVILVNMVALSRPSGT